MNLFHHNKPAISRETRRYKIKILSKNINGFTRLLHKPSKCTKPWRSAPLQSTLVAWVSSSKYCCSHLKRPSPQGDQPP